MLQKRLVQLLKQNRGYQICVQILKVQLKANKYAIKT